MKKYIIHHQWIVHRLLPTARRPLPTVHCPLPTAYCLLLTAYCLLLTAYGSYAQTLQVVTKTIEKTLDAQKIEKIQIWGERSDIEISTWNKNEIRAIIELSAKHPDRKTAEKDLETLQYSLQTTAKMLNLHNFVVLSKNGTKPQSNLKARFTLFVPAACTVEIQNSFGKTIVRGLQNQTQVQTEFCAVELTDLRGKISSRTQFGTLKAHDLSGKLSFVSERTDLLLQQIKGECRIRAQYGSLDIQTDKAQVKLDIETNNVELRNGTTVAKQ